ncbi:hypothetical protein FOG18_00795 [Legionella israelensis]|uniref:hypothetical protein n=1 Tax=Legionella israelensis TaxID=454 RepID=UPI00117D3638|nr:hypothetical protein [Legionella israelensis]QDP71224.1 hypothetical protein FOG18_00795 [Legionella israelensis]
MFNLIVNHSAWGKGRDSFPCSRIFEYTDQSLEKKFKPEGQLDLVALTGLPTVFVQETFGEGEQIVKFGKITRAYMSSQDVALEYFFDQDVQPILNRDFQTFAAELEIKDFEFSRTHWSIKDVDLFRVLLRNLQPRRSMPTVFQISDPEAIEPSLISAMMPFDPRFTSVYETIKQVADALGLRCRRADDIWENPAVIQDVVSLIDRSSVVICDCSTRNPNVFYEIGIAHALGREVILITQSDVDIPFDLRHLRYVTYLNNDQGRTELATRLQSRLETLLA